MPYKQWHRHSSIQKPRCEGDLFCLVYNIHCFILNRDIEQLCNDRWWHIMIWTTPTLYMLIEIVIIITMNIEIFTYSVNLLADILFFKWCTGHEDVNEAINICQNNKYFHCFRTPTLGTEEMGASFSKQKQKFKQTDTYASVTLNWKTISYRDEENFEKCS